MKDSLQKILILDQNLFQNNYAVKEGGAIKFNEIEPFGYLNNSYINNSAIYGINIAAFPFRILFQNSQKKTICKNDSTLNCYETLPNIASGSELQFPLEFILKDIYNHTYSSINDGSIFFLKKFLDF